MVKFTWGTIEKIIMKFCIGIGIGSRGGGNLGVSGSAINNGLVRFRTHLPIQVIVTSKL
jgi:hypothetical protein